MVLPTTKFNTLRSNSVAPPVLQPLVFKNALSSALVSGLLPASILCVRNQNKHAVMDCCGFAAVSEHCGIRTFSFQ